MFEGIGSIKNSNYKIKLTEGENPMMLLVRRLLSL